MRVALINTNRIRPPVAPIGLDYVAECLAAAGHGPEVLDLCWEEDWGKALERFLRGGDFGVVGLSIRNTDDCSFATRESFLPGYAAMTACIRRHSEAPVVAGGVGFSVMPETVLRECGADAGVLGDGEFAMAEIASRIGSGLPWTDLPNLVLRDGPGIRRTPVARRPLEDLPTMSRSWVDNPRYFREGGQAGIETKRGCPKECIYCADPVAKGRSPRLRPPAAVADEIGALLAQGIDHLHTCDSEFNVPEAHAAAVCREIVRRDFGGALRWYAYCAPAPFSRDLAALMGRAGCAGINFGVDSGDEAMLKRLGRDHGPGDILSAARLCRENGIAVMFDLMLGAPGETPRSVARTVDLVRQALPDRAGIAVGVRVYPGTPLSRRVAANPGGTDSPGAGDGDPSRPVFFLDPAVAPVIFDLLDRLVGDDERFFFFDPSRPKKNYNYNANQLLVEAIRAGHRGAYWDILRRCAGD